MRPDDFIRQAEAIGEAVSRRGRDLPDLTTLDLPALKAELDLWLLASRQAQKPGPYYEARANAEAIRAEIRTREMER